MIGTGGKVIREIVEKTGAKINIEDDGTVKVASSDGKSIEAAHQVDQVASPTSPKSARSTRAPWSRPPISAPS